MTRKRTNKKSNKKSYSKIYLSLLLIVILGISSLATILYSSPTEDSKNKIDTESSSNTEDLNNQTNKDPEDKWLFAMDTAQVQILYQASGIPTLVIIDKNGEYVFYSPGAQQKETLDPYIDGAFDGTAKAYGTVPDFSVTTFDNQKFTLSDYKGKVVLIDIMGVGCQPCIQQMPELQKIKKERGDDITIISIDTYYQGETKEDVIEAYGEYIKM